MPPDLPLPHEDVAEAWIGRRLRRIEDDRLLRGTGCFTADWDMPGALHAVVVRSQRAAARLIRVETDAARAMPGVVAVLTAEDAARDGLGGIPWEVCPPGMTPRFPGDPAISEPQPLLAGARLRHVGEPVALVVATTLAEALDAAEAVAVVAEDTTPLVDVHAAMAPGAPPVGRDASNLLFTHAVGDAAATAGAFARAAGIVTLEHHVPRLVAAPIETRGYLARYDAAEESWILVAAAGKPHPVRDTIARFVLKVDPARIRLIAPDLGGGFGAKNVAHAEAALVLWAARRVGRPVRWIGSRSEAFLSDMQGRDHAIRARLAFAADGALLAVDYDSIVNLGAYLAPRAVTPCLSGMKVLTGPYRIAAAHARVRAVLTNTVPTCPYRGAGVPEAALTMERLVDKAARRLGLDGFEIRRRNLVRPDELPWRSPTGTTLHSVDFPAMLEAAASRAGAPASPGGSLRHGRGVAFTIEAYGTAYEEGAELLATADGGIAIRIGTKSGGQSHETGYAQIAAEVLGLPPERIAVIQGDTALIADGHGTGASRSMTTGGSAVLRAAEALLATARDRAAVLLQGQTEALSYDAGCFIGPRGGSATLAAIAAAEPEGVLRGRARYRPSDFNIPGGCHLAEVTLDTDTGEIRLTRYEAVHDAGVAINPTVVEGQLRGGIAQGIGAGLMEGARWDAETAQPLTASFLDYAMPRAGDLCAMTVTLQGTRCRSNALGAKAVGEAGPVAAPPAVANAIADALAGLGVEDVPLPASPAAVWALLRVSPR